MTFARSKRRGIDSEDSRLEEWSSKVCGRPCGRAREFAESATGHLVALRRRLSQESDLDIGTVYPAGLVVVVVPFDQACFSKVHKC
jgi:hypothetical protein